MITATLNGHEDGDWRSAYRRRIAERSGPLDVLAGKTVLVLADVENLYYGAKDFGLSIRFDQIARLLREYSGHAALHAFFSCKRGDNRQAKRFQSHGWIAHPNAIRTVRHKGELVTLANSDNVILFSAGYLTVPDGIELVVIGTGDGELGYSLAERIVRRRPGASVVTLSLAESTSYSLDARSNPFIDANMELGLDCLSNLRPSLRAGWFLEPKS